MQAQKLTGRFCLFDGYYYQCVGQRGDSILLLLPGFFEEGYANMSPAAGRPLLIQTMLWADRKHCQFWAEPNATPLPAIPLSRSLAIGSRVQWGTSLAEWSVLSLDGDMAVIRQVSGYAAAIEFDAPVGELAPLLAGDRAIEYARAA